MSNLTREQVEEWLDDNPDAYFDYSLRKLELSSINAWLVTHGFPSVTRFVPPEIDDKRPFAVSFRKALTRFLAGAPSSSNLKAHELLFGIGQDATNSRTSLRQDFAKSKSRSMFKTHEPSTSEPSDSRRNSLKDMRKFAPRKSTVYRFDLAVHIHNRKTLLYPVYSSSCYRYTSLPPTTVSMLSALIESKVKLPRGFPFHGKAMKKNMRESKGENTFFLSIVRDVATELDVANLSVKAVENLAVLVNSEGASLYLIENRRGGPVLVSRYFHARGSSESSGRAGRSDGSEASETREIVVPMGSGILGFVAESGETVNVRVACQDPRFDKQIDNIVGFRTDSLLCMPVKNAYDEIIAVVQIVNKNKTVDGGYFTESDIATLTTYLQFIGIAITNSQIMDDSRQEYERNRNLLEVVHDLFEEQTSLERVMVKIMQRAQKLIECDKAAIFLLEDTVENSTYARLFELAANSSSSDDEQTPQQKERARAVTRYLVSVAEKVVVSGKLLNIAEVVDVEVDHQGIIQNLLAMPIRNSRCQIIGVANLLDKENEMPFDENDEQLFEAFTIFCGLGIHNTLMYIEIQKAVARQKVALEVLSYHASASTKEVEGLVKAPIPCADDFDLYSLTFDDFSLDPDEMVKAAASMFLQLNLVKRFAIEKDTLYRFLVSVKKNYRDVPYHNWRHAFNVSQFMFAILMGCDMKDTFSELEVLGMFVGCLCHDLDHRGTNNAFQQKSGSPLVLLYGTTNTMEHHHFNHAVMILSAESNNIFSGLLPEEYSKVMEILKHSILATDLSMYFQNRARFFELVKTRTYSWELEYHRELLRSMLMTASDLAASCKPWEVQKRVAQLVTSEFFEQGDKERDELHLTPQPLMDRERRHELPQLQMGWMNDICIPLYDSLGEMNPKMSAMCEGAIANRDQWQRIVDGKDTMTWDSYEENP